NIVAGREIVREFIQDDAEPALLAAEMQRLLNDAEYIQQVCDDLSCLRKQLGTPGCSDRVADMVADMLGIEQIESA
ncbi:MAG: lipid-A-disaccharide synthase, partial [Pelovirga sp.]